MPFAPQTVTLKILFLERTVDRFVSNTFSKFRCEMSPDHGKNDESFDSCDGHDVRKLHRVNRFLARMDIDSVPSIKEGEIRSHVPEGRFRSRNIFFREASCSMERTMPADTSFNVNCRYDCDGSSDSPSYNNSGCVDSSFHTESSSSDQEVCGIEGRKVVITKKSPIKTSLKTNDISTRRRNKNVQRFNAAKQNHRVKTLASNEGNTGHDFCWDQALRERESPTSVKDTSFNSFASDQSPRSVADTFTTHRSNSRKQAFNFIRVETNRLNGIMARDLRNCNGTKKNLTWWDDEANSHKTFMLRTDEKSHLKSDTSHVPVSTDSCNPNDVFEVILNFMQKTQCRD